MNMFERNIENNNLISQCLGFLRHFVAKISHLKINVPHNDMTFLHVITRKDNEQIINVLEQSDVVISNTGTTLTPPLSLYKGRGCKVKEILNQVQNDNRTIT